MQAPTSTPGPAPSRLQRWLFNVLQRHAEKTSVATLQRKYPHLDRDALAAKYVRSASRATLGAGALATALVSLLELPALAAGLGTIISFFTASPVTIPLLAIALPLAVVVFGLELAYTVRRQVQMVYDLFLIYDLPVDLHNPDDLWRVFLLGIGAKRGETSVKSLRAVAPLLLANRARDLVGDELIRKPVQRWAARGLYRQLARRYLAESFLLKMVVPGASIVLGAGWNYVTSRGLGQTIVARVKARERAQALVDQLPLPAGLDPLLVARAGASMLALDHLKDSEAVAYGRLLERLAARRPAFEAALAAEAPPAWEDLRRALAAVQNRPEQEALLAVMQVMAVVGGHFSRARRQRLRAVAGLFGLPLDETALAAQAKPFTQPRPGRSCFVAAVILGVLLTLSALTCLAALAWTVVAVQPPG